MKDPSAMVVDDLEEDSILDRRVSRRPTASRAVGIYCGCSSKDRQAVTAGTLIVGTITIRQTGATLTLLAGQAYRSRLKPLASRGARWRWPSCEKKNRQAMSDHQTVLAAFIAWKVSAATTASLGQISPVGRNCLPGTIARPVALPLCRFFGSPAASPRISGGQEHYQELSA